MRVLSTKGLFFIEVSNSIFRSGNSVIVPKLITEDTGVSHAVHSLQTGPLVLVLHRRRKAILGTVAQSREAT